MSSSQNNTVEHEEYYVPEQSKLPIFASIGLFLTVWGAANWLNGSENGPMIFFGGSLMFAFVLWNWFSIVISENIQGLNSTQLKKSYVLGMAWFIFSEVMFFAAFFGALFYVRSLAGPWLAGEGDAGLGNHLIWPGYEHEWPVMTTPDMAANGEGATMRGPDQNMSNPGLANWFGWLPFWNTAILLTSSVTVHIAHGALKKDNRSQFNLWLGLTVVLGIAFIILQIEEYVHAYQEMGLTLESGIYGATFFLLTGFHGAHVTLGTFMLLVMFLRSVLKGHFKSDDHFGFESASWYWHFVDVVWVGLFLYVYVFG
ncbi:cytochrome c oxidase subunit 3 [Pseudoteredinibacter isoporae]|uniref:cytochrome-c oxidase n=1 Tax=Pseudoteredinibacter isoporae TaxID=570281 RepID=A0A7X0JQ43_9GAMM|nr:cytochrome c oxidase subunit 3 [Pseudoteredinibacter isoporae]MBB6520132.1 cytochrome c oxidase subunit 3 [Pseudoteredinibacter isoporae]NHO85704.1 cytochrome c oxidase subunit 3 [Pseudoteredinibacter isoporae]NIB25844.1 cytochrome c oxidase subunit 3 [Pseudoteredinibacter isoporae]